MAKERPAPFVPESVNYHLTRQCNYRCRFCFHTASTSHHEPLERAMHGLRLLAATGMRKINFSGGEPFLIARGDHVGSLVRFCKEQLGVESVTIVTNGSRVRRDWFDKYGRYLDIMAVSCDSFEPPTLAALGRGTGQESYNQHLARIAELASWCADSGVKFKINSVITALNAEEDMRDAIRELAPVRWKVFQCLAIEGENSGTVALRDASSLMISAATFQRFVDRHRELACLVPECNDDMRNSYLILDEFMRFLDNTHGLKRPSRSILDVGVSAALCDSGFDAAAFERRGGRYNWSRPVGGSASGLPVVLTVGGRPASA